MPVNYIEGITLFERMEIGFNTFYTYREGESAWIYAQGLRALHHLAGAACFSIDPYQLGLNNDEAIESGAFWFYRKLGFRPTRPELAKLTQSEEQKIAGDRAYRTPVRTLHSLCTAPMIYELPDSKRAPGEWDRFSIRNVCLAVQRRMASEFGGDASRIREASAKQIARALGLKSHDLGKRWQGIALEIGLEADPASEAFSDLALVLALIPDLANWSSSEKRAVAQIIRAKAGRSDEQYARLLQKHQRLRKSIIKIGSVAS